MFQQNSFALIHNHVQDYLVLGYFRLVLELFVFIKRGNSFELYKKT